MILKIKYWNFHSLDTNPPTLSTYPAIISRAAFVRAKGRIEKRPESLPYFRPSLNRPSPEFGRDDESLIVIDQTPVTGRENGGEGGWESPQ